MSHATTQPPSNSPFSEREQQAKRVFQERLAATDNPDKQRFTTIFLENLERIETLRHALDAYPPVLAESKLGSRERGLGTLVELLANATDADFEMFLPMRAWFGAVSPWRD